MEVRFRPPQTRVLCIQDHYGHIMAIMVVEVLFLARKVVFSIGLVNSWHMLIPGSKVFLR